MMIHYFRHYLVGLSLAGVDMDKGMPHLEKALEIFVSNNLDEDVIKDIKERVFINIYLA